MDHNALPKRATKSPKPILRWSLRDFLWMLIVVSLLLSLFVISPMWKQASLTQVLLPNGEANFIFMHGLDSGVDHVTYISVIGSDVVLVIEVHKFDDVSTKPSTKTLVDDFHVPAGHYAITWWKQEEKKATNLYCVCNGNMLHASLPRAKDSLRERSTGSIALAQYKGQSSNLYTLVENRNNKDCTNRIELVLRCKEK